MSMNLNVLKDDYNLLKRKDITIAYLRVSTDEQADDGFSLDFQEDVTKQFAISNKFMHLLILREEGQSGTTLNRPKMKRLLELVTYGIVGNIIIYDLDRLSRNTMDIMYLMNLFNEQGVKLCGINFEPKYKSADDKFSLRIKSLLAQLESEKTGERTIRCIKQSYQQGNYACPAVLFGYKRNNENTLDVIEEEIEIVKYIFQQYIYCNKNIEEIKSDILNIYCYEMKASKVARIIKNERYTGSFKYHDLNLSGYGLLKIITKEEFEVANNKIKRQTKSKKYNYLFEAKVYCSECLSLLKCKPGTGKKKKIYFYYVCNNICCNCYNKQISEIKLIKLHKEKIVNLHNKYSFLNKKQKIYNINELCEQEMKILISKYFKPIYIQLKKD